MGRPHETEGEVDFLVVGIPTQCKTFYKIIGVLSPTKTPIIIVHGGPGGTHDSMLAFTDLWTTYAIPVLFYDQIGNGRSTHLPEKNGDTDFWVPELFRRELENLIRELGLSDGPVFSLLGHSWGGALAADFASYRPKGLRKIVAANPYASLQRGLKAYGSSWRSFHTA